MNTLSTLGVSVPYDTRFEYVFSASVFLWGLSVRKALGWLKICSLQQKHLTYRAEGTVLFSVWTYFSTYRHWFTVRNKHQSELTRPRDKKQTQNISLVNNPPSLIAEMKPSEQ